MPCAGVGSRSGARQPKQYAQVAGQPLVAHTLAAFAGVPDIARVVVVLAPDDAAWPVAPGAYELIHQGGDSRAASVRAGLAHLLASGASAQDWVMVHDAARCLLRPVDVKRLMDACIADGQGGLLALPLPDTLKQADAQGRVAQTLSRSDKWLAQTPQMFRLQALLDALLDALSGDLDGITDEASAMERAGVAPLLVAGPSMNIKVTYPEDFALADAVLRSRVDQGAQT